MWMAQLPVNGSSTMRIIERLRLGKVLALREPQVRSVKGVVQGVRKAGLVGRRRVDGLRRRISFELQVSAVSHGSR